MTSTPDGAPTSVGPAVRERGAVEWPEEMTPDLAAILGRMCFQCIRICHVFRAAGRKIETRAEAEQAFVLHWLLGLWFKHGARWREVGEAELAAARALATPPASAERALPLQGDGG